ncbi:MAG TPA: bifunctional DNA-formamidopyrimidine glycosylase/DNA-(apurinic or apyrimidinic site) lyase [Longimicrobiales bacterium]|nr:bifunctional DNA-formamidopyrimidine glycosylase/DNA-(apurinic or apyrimidinic site) lyase [Longimicrobiales bacterium]
MPELPEAETIVRDLRARVPGSTVTRVMVTRPDVLHTGLTPAALGRRLKGRCITGVSRRGKNVVLEFDGPLRLVINLGMTGRVVTSDAARAADLRHIAVRIVLDDGRDILYDDSRRFGDLDLRDAEGWRARDAELGLEPLSDAFTAAALHALTRTSIVPIRNWLLDQRRVAGVGNIYAVEALFRAGIRPTRRAKTLTRRETAALRDTLRAVLQESIDARGTTISDYRDASGERGGFDRWLRVYDRAGMPCRECGTPIKRVVLSNRSAFYCPHCQK